MATLLRKILSPDLSQGSWNILKKMCHYDNDQNRQIKNYLNECCDCDIAYISSCSVINVGMLYVVHW